MVWRSNSWVRSATCCSKPLNRLRIWAVMTLNAVAKRPISSLVMTGTFKSRLPAAICSTNSVTFVMGADNIRVAPKDEAATIAAMINTNTMVFLVCWLAIVRKTSWGWKKLTCQGFVSMAVTATWLRRSPVATSLAVKNGSSSAFINFNERSGSSVPNSSGGKLGKRPVSMSRSI